MIGQLKLIGTGPIPIAEVQIVQTGPVGPEGPVGMKGDFAPILLDDEPTSDDSAISGQLAVLPTAGGTPGRLWVNLADSRLGQPPEWVPFVTPPTVVQVVHGGDSNAIRPANAQTVYWVGYVEPIYAKTWDRWLQTNEIEHE